MLRRYREELQRRAVEPDDGVRSHVRIQGLESYNFKLNPTYVAKFALDSKTIQLAEASDSGREKSATFPTSKAPFSAVFRSFRLIFGRAIISRNGLEA